MEGVENQEPNCVRVSRIMKTVSNGNIARHIDYILERASILVGDIAYVYIYKSNSSNNPCEFDTVGHIQLKDHKKHKQLAFMLDGFNFHNRRLRASVAYHYFSSIDDSYQPRPIYSCKSCEQFETYVLDKEDRIREQAIQDSINNVTVFVPKCKVVDEKYKIADSNKDNKLKHADKEASSAAASSLFKDDQNNSRAESKVLDLEQKNVSITATARESRLRRTNSETSMAAESIEVISEDEFPLNMYESFQNVDLNNLDAE